MICLGSRSRAVDTLTRVIEASGTTRRRLTDRHRKKRDSMNTILRNAAALTATLACASANAGNNTWTAVGPFGGSIVDVEFLSADNAVALASTDSSVYRSENHGASWTRVLDYPHAGGVPVDISVDPNDNEHVLLISDLTYRSLDGGRTWNDFLSAPPAQVSQPSCIRFSRDGTIVWVGTRDGRVYRSIDGAASWQEHRNGLPLGVAILDVDVDAVDANVAYVRLGNERIYRTIDGGATWAPIPGTDQYTHLAASPVMPSVLLATRGGDSYRSFNRGDTWLHSSFPGASLVEYSPTIAGRALGVSNTQNYTRETFDHGHSWFGGSKPPVLRATALTVHGDDNRRGLMATTLGMLSTDDAGSTWAESNAGIREATHGRFAVAEDGSDVIYTSSYDAASIYRRDPATGAWQGVATQAEEVFGTPGRSHIAIAVAPDDSNRVYMSRANRFGKSVDRGATWTQATFSYLRGYSLTFDRRQPLVGYAGTLADGVQKTIDGGDFWNPASSGLPAVAIGQVAIDPTDSNVLYAATGETTGVGVFKSTNAGASWAAANSGIEALVVHEVAFEPGNSAILYAATKGGLYKSANAGASWTRVFPDASSSAIEVTDVVIDPLKPTTLFVATTGDPQIMRSVDAGQTWERILQPENRRTSGYWLALLPSEPNQLIAAQHGSGLAEMLIAPALRMESDVHQLAIDATQTIVLTARNHGPYSATGVRVEATLPPAANGYTVTTDASTCTQSEARLTCDVGILRGGADARVTIAFAPSTAGTALEASISGHEPDTLASDDTISIPVRRVAIVSSSLDVPSRVVANEQFTASASIVNEGPSPAPNTRVRFSLPIGTRIISLTGIPGCTFTGPTAEITCTIGEMAGGATVQVGMTMSVDRAASTFVNAQVLSDVQGVQAGPQSVAPITIDAAPSPPPAAGGSDFGAAFAPFLVLLQLVRYRRTRSSRLIFGAREVSKSP